MMGLAAVYLVPARICRQRGRQKITKRVNSRTMGRVVLKMC